MNIVISGGTDGIGRELAGSYLTRGDSVLVLGSNGEKGRAFLAAAEAIGAGKRAFYEQVDLSLLSETEKAVDTIAATFSSVDVLVLGARFYRSTRSVTAEGLESNFALFYLSRFLLGYRLVDLLEKAGRPVIMNVAGPGSDLSVVRWDDLELEREYHGGTALAQGGKLNDLLGVAFAEKHGTGPITYVLFHPGVVSGGFTGEYDEADAAHIAELKKIGKTVDHAAASISAVIDAPPAEPLSAFVEGRRISVDHPSFSKQAAARLDAQTRDLLESRMVG